MRIADYGRVLKDSEGSDTIFFAKMSLAHKREISRLWRMYLALEDGYKQGVFGKESLFRMQGQVISWIENIKSGVNFKIGRVL
jgi:hypothetical protein